MRTPTKHTRHTSTSGETLSNFELSLRRLCLIFWIWYLHDTYIHIYLSCLSLMTLMTDGV